MPHNSKKNKNRNKSSSDQLCWLFFLEEEGAYQVFKEENWPAGNRNSQRNYVLSVPPLSTDVAAIQRNTPTHTHTLHQQVDRNTHGKNNVTAKTWFTWFRWWQWFEKQKNKKKKWFFFWYVTCANSLLFFLSLEAEPYLSDNIYL